MNHQPLKLKPPPKLYIEITTKALHILRLVTETKGKKKAFPRLNWDHITSHAKFKAWHYTGGFSPQCSCCEIQILVITSIYFKVVWVGYILSDWMESNKIHTGHKLYGFPRHLRFSSHINKGLKSFKRLKNKLCKTTVCHIMMRDAYK